MRCCHYFAGRGQPGGRVLLEDHTECEKAWTFMKGIPTCGKEAVLFPGKDGVKQEVMAYTMNAPYEDQPAILGSLFL